MNSGSSASAGGHLYRCVVCTKEFEAASKLTIHMRSHTQEKPFACDLCQRRFSVESNLKRHRKTVHSPEKLFHCSICGKAFNQKCNVKRHELVHRDTDPAITAAAVALITPARQRKPESPVPQPRRGNAFLHPHVVVPRARRPVPAKLLITPWAPSPLLYPSVPMEYAQRHWAITGQALLNESALRNPCRSPCAH